MKTLILFFAMILAAALQADAQALQYPVTKKVDQVDDYFGIKVPDPYRWLEDDYSEETKQWVEAQNKVTFAYLERIPFRKKLYERLEQLYNYPKYSTPFRKGEYYFFYKNDGLQNQSVLYVQKGLDGKPEVFLDPNTFSEDGTVRLGLFAVSKDAKYAAYSLSRGGSDWQEVYVMEVASKTKLPDVLRWVKVSSIAWQGNGFYYSRYPAPTDTNRKLSAKNENHQVFYHRIGEPQEKDELVFEDKENPLRFHILTTTEDERFSILSVSDRGKGKDGNALYVRDHKKGDKTFRPIVTSFDDDFAVIDNLDDKLLVVTNRQAPNRKVVLIDPKKPEEKNWKTILPEKPEPLANITSAGGKLFAVYMKDVAHRVYVYDYNGRFENEIDLPTLGTVSGFEGEKSDKEVFYTFTSFTFPPTIYRYNILTKKSELFRKPEVKFNSTDYETKQVFYQSKDGTRVPMFIVHKKGLRQDGANPTLLYGYGGFNISLNPSFNPLRIAWLEQGGIYAVANIRGGGEYGEKWHEQGMKLKKQNVFDDFIAAAEFLIREKYTSPEKLAIQGGSNGGLLVGAVINQRPELFRVAIPEVGVMDMLRFHKFTIGWNWIADYGSSENYEEFKVLYSYSPLHNIKEGLNYPAVLITTADHDDRVVPAHSFKYAATLQEKYKGNNPILIRIETKSGHGAVSTKKALEAATDIYAFIFYNIGVTPKFGGDSP
ncbi:MAG: prolyl oligopeptidase family serine peptidase [Chloroherpetonaceae bacterium]|nr:prolyl oligopeptidase family serine peptidase [Chloroherpetonaceae bacterium]